MSMPARPNPIDPRLTRHPITGEPQCGYQAGSDDVPCAKDPGHRAPHRCYAPYGPVRWVEYDVATGVEVARSEPQAVAQRVHRLLPGGKCACGEWQAPLGAPVTRGFDRHLAEVLGAEVPPIPGVPEGQWADPEQWVEWFVGLDRSQQLVVAARRIDDVNAAHTCFIANHAGLVDRVQLLERRLAELLTLPTVVDTPATVVETRSDRQVRGA